VVGFVPALKVKSWAVPVRPTVWVLPVVPLLLSVTVTVPVSGPLVPAVGVKVTLIVQVPVVAATLVPQVLVWAKLVPTVTLATVRGTAPLLLKVMVCAALVVPTN